MAQVKGFKPFVGYLNGARISVVGAANVFFGPRYGWKKVYDVERGGKVKPLSAEETAKVTRCCGGCSI